MRRRAFLATSVYLFAGAKNLRGVQRHELLHDHGAIRIEGFDQFTATQRELITGWIRSAIQAVSSYYGRFPVPALKLNLRTSSTRRPVSGGVTWPSHPPSIQVSVNHSVTSEQLRRDWVLTHEFVHLAFPSVSRSHRWIEEGLASYVEPIARITAGQYREAQFWAEMVEGLPSGFPMEGDRGLDHTHTWGRTYWGGALFCFCVDFLIRMRTGNRSGLPAALRAILKSGGTVDQHWPLAKALHIGDQAVGVPALSDLYDAWKDSPETPDLPEIWCQLGVVSGRRSISFADDAPLAWVRHAITRSDVREQSTPG